MKRSYASLISTLGLAIGCTYLPTPATADNLSSPASAIRGTTGSRNPEQITPDIYPKGAVPSPEPIVRYGRYTLVSTRPSAEQQDLLAQIIDIKIPANMNPSVREAMDHLMLRTGYSLCPAPVAVVSTLYSRPLPSAHYQLGPVTLRNALQVLAGPAFKVDVDEINREICFSVRSEYAPTSVATAVVPSMMEANPVSSTQIEVQTDE